MRETSKLVELNAMSLKAWMNNMILIKGDIKHIPLLMKNTSLFIMSLAYH